LTPDVRLDYLHRNDIKAFAGLFGDSFSGNPFFCAMTQPKHPARSHHSTPKKSGARKCACNQMETNLSTQIDHLATRLDAIFLLILSGSLQGSANGQADKRTPQDMQDDIRELRAENRHLSVRIDQMIYVIVSGAVLVLATIIGIVLAQLP
jgi:hypothetical protein